MQARENWEQNRERMLSEMQPALTSYLSDLRLAREHLIAQLEKVNRKIQATERKLNNVSSK